MIEQYKYKNWVFTWNANADHELPNLFELNSFLKENCESYAFQFEKGEITERVHFQGLFRVKYRMRQQTILNNFMAEFGGLAHHLTINRMIGTWKEAYAYATKEETRVKDTIVYQSSNLQEYTGADLALFNEKDNWFRWQKQIFYKYFTKGTIIPEVPDDRQIVWITDKEGNSGKSKFTKFLCFNNHDIDKVPFGSAAQIRSSVCNMGPKMVYILDIPRTLGEDDSMRSIISVVEDIKNGFVVSSMYGRSQRLLMDPPHVIVFSNEDCPSDLMSNDRWTIYKLEKFDMSLCEIVDNNAHPGNGFTPEEEMEHDPDVMADFLEAQLDDEELDDMDPSS